MSEAGVIRWWKVYLAALSFLLLIFVSWQLVLGRNLYKREVICEGTFRDKTLPKELCPFGSYCAKVEGNGTGLCKSYLDFFKEKPKRLNTIWK